MAHRTQTAHRMSIDPRTPAAHTLPGPRLLCRQEILVARNVRLPGRTYSNGCNLLGHWERSHIADKEYLMHTRIVNEPLRRQCQLGGGIEQMLEKLGAAPRPPRLRSHKNTRAPIPWRASDFRRLFQPVSPNGLCFSSQSRPSARSICMRSALTLSAPTRRTSNRP